MSAFFSGTDDNDDKGSYLFSGVVGKLNLETPEVIFRTNLGDDGKVKAELHDIFEHKVDVPAVPEEWLEKVTISGGSYSWGGYGGLWAGSDYGDYDWPGGRQGGGHATFRGGQQTSGKQTGPGSHGRSLGKRHYNGVQNYIDKDNFWSILTGADLTEDDLAQLEKEFGVTFDEEFRSIFARPADGNVVYLPAGASDEEEVIELMDVVQKPGPDFDRMLRVAGGFIEVSSDTYRSLVTLSVYDTIFKLHEDGWVASVSGGFKEINHSRKAGISFTPWKFSQEIKPLAMYAESYKAFIDAGDFASDVWELLHDLNNGLVY